MSRKTSQLLTADLAHSLNITFRPKDEEVCAMMQEVMEKQEWSCGMMGAVLGIAPNKLAQVKNNKQPIISDVLRRLIWFLWVMDKDPEVLANPILIASWGRSKVRTRAKLKTSNKQTPEQKALALAEWFATAIPACLHPHSPCIAYHWSKTDSQLAEETGRNPHWIATQRNIIAHFIRHRTTDWYLLCKRTKIRQSRFAVFQDELHKEQLARRSATRPSRAKKKCNTCDTFPLTVAPEQCEAAPVAENITQENTTHESKTESSPPVLPCPVHAEIGERL